MLTLPESVICLTSSDITTDELRVLGLGTSFNQNATASAIVKSVASLHRATWRQPEEQLLKGAFITGFLDLMEQEPTLPRRYRLAIGKLRKRKDIIILPADKGSKVVIMDRLMYINAAEEMLSDRRVYKKLKGQGQLNYRISRLNLKLRLIQSALPSD